jgi:electron transport complex protein RnfB
MSRRRFVGLGLRGLAALALGALGLRLFGRAGQAPRPKTVWQIDPYKCVHCGACCESCVLAPSAVKATHAFDMCGYCDLCGAYFNTAAKVLSTAAENQLCPAGAIVRNWVEDPFYEYLIDEKRCVACALCVRTCASFGNASLYLQIKHDRCLNCNECSCARSCPAGAIVRVPAERPYIAKGGRGA